MANTTRTFWVTLTLSFAALAFGVIAAPPSLAAAPPCTAAAAQAAAPPGMTVRAINDLNPELPAVSTGALLVTAAGKQFLQNWYAGALARSYFFGCSDGGREGMVQATRYPADFDGYIVGDPFFDVPGQILAGRGRRALLDAPDSHIPPALLTLFDDAVCANCDAADGLKDNLIQNPGKCSFNPESLICRGGDTVNCLTQNQANTMSARFSAAKDEQGRVVSLGFPVSDVYNNGAPGNNLFRWTEAAGPPRDINSADPWGQATTEQAAGWAFYDKSFKYLVYLDPHFDNNRHSAVDRRGVVNEVSLALIESRTPAGLGDDPQKLAPFAASDRKMILFHGYDDGFINPFRTIRFCQDWAKLRGGYEALWQNARLFMVPGMYHCNRGPGPNFFDALGAIEQWVEHGRAPEQMIATKYTNDDRRQPVLRTMPLCSFPTQAHYSGNGDVNSAASWSCTENQDLLQVGPNGVSAGLVGRFGTEAGSRKARRRNH